MDPSAEPISYFATTNHRRPFVRFGIKQADRLSHLYLIGRTGTGKSSLIEILAREDLAQGRGFALIDPHGDLVERLVAGAPAELAGRVTYVNVPDRSQPYGYNPLRRVRGDLIPLAAAGLIDTLRKLWSQAWGVRMEHVLRNSLYALLERDDSTLAEVLRLYADKNFRRQIVRGIRNQVVKRYWLDEFENYPPRLQAEAVGPIQNKLGALLADPTLYRVLVAPQVDLRFRTLMDEGRVLLVNLAKGRLGEDATLLLGGLLVSTLGLAAYSRADTAEAQRRPFIFYVDEFQNFTTLAFANMMSELRKYGVGLTLAHQHLAQLEPEVRQAVLGNIGTLISFRVGVEDAPLLAREFQPTFSVLDLLNLPNQRIYLKLMIDGTPSKPFSATTLPIRAPPAA
jgi:DNA helicase HerA-like ATPase